MEEKMKQNIESKILERYQGIKVDDDLYLIPGNIGNSEDEVAITLVKSDIKGEVSDSLSKFNVNRGDTLTVRLTNEFNSEVKIMEVINLVNGDVVEFKHIGSLDHEDREGIVNTIGNYYKGKEIAVIYYLPFNFEGLLEIEKEDN